MYHGDDEPTEVLHIYVVREVVTPPLLPIVLSVLALSVFLTFGALSPIQQPVARAVIRVPAVPLTIQTFTAQATIIPTGIKVYPATTAHGILTITNGSVISQMLPAELTFISSSGISVMTDAAVFVPAGNANGYGWAQVRAHAVTSGHGGNLSPYSINSVVGSSIYVRNTSSLYGGRDSYSVKYVSSLDKQRALLQARGILLNKSSGLHYPCSESRPRITGVIEITWRCQFVNYHIPAFYHVTAARLSGKNLIIDVWFIPRPARTWVK